MKNESLRRYWLTRWVLGLETLLLFALVDGLVIACKTGIINGGEALAFLAGYLLICAGTMATAHMPIVLKSACPPQPKNSIDIGHNSPRPQKEWIKVNQNEAAIVIDSDAVPVLKRTRARVITQSPRAPYAAAAGEAGRARVISRERTQPKSSGARGLAVCEIDDHETIPRPPIEEAKPHERPI